MSFESWSFLYWISVLGLVVSVLSALETKVNWIASLCAFFGQGCRRTADFTLFKVPISWWGAAYYILLMGTAAIAPALVFWLIMAGLGFELTFIYILAIIRAFCIFCFLNAFVVLLLVIWAFDPALVWEAAGTALFFFTGSYFLLRLENRSMLLRAGGLAGSSELKINEKDMSSLEEDGSPAAGPVDASVKVIEFSDYQCPACRKGKRTSKKIKEEYKNNVKWVYKNFPLPQHEQAELMAIAAHCAQEQGKFWEYHDRLYSMAEKPDAEALVTIARELNLDTTSFRNCLKRQRHRERIKKDKAAANEAGVAAVPTYIINGRILSGSPSYEEFSNLIEEELGRKIKS
jgi:protein-disulfide isomerase